MHKQDGFTLLELLIVIVVIAILTLIIVPSFSGYADRGRIGGGKQLEASTLNTLGAFASGLYDFENNFNDDSGYNLAGTAVGTVSYADNESLGGKAITLDGTSYVNVPYSTQFDFGTESVTFSAWVKTSYTGSVYIRALGKEALSTRQGFTFYNDGSDTGKMRFFISDGTNLVANTLDKAVNDDKWHQVTFVADRRAQRARGYIDGKIQKWKETGGTDSHSLSNVGSISSNTDFRVGRTVGGGGVGSGWIGQIDRVRIFGEALSGSTAQFMYAMGVLQFSASSL